MRTNNRWFQLVASLISMIMIANLQYSWTLFVQPLRAGTGWRLSDIQFAFCLKPVLPIVAVLAATLEEQFVGATGNRLTRRDGGSGWFYLAASQRGIPPPSSGRAPASRHAAHVVGRHEDARRTNCSARPSRSRVFGVRRESRLRRCRKMGNVDGIRSFEECRTHGQREARLPPVTGAKFSFAGCAALVKFTSGTHLSSSVSPRPRAGCAHACCISNELAT